MWSSHKGRWYNYGIIIVVSKCWQLVNYIQSIPLFNDPSLSAYQQQNMIAGRTPQRSQSLHEIDLHSNQLNSYLYKKFQMICVGLVHTSGSFGYHLMLKISYISQFNDLAS